MVNVPAGKFLMGSTNADSDAGDNEAPQHTVTLDAFWIDWTEVTNDQYRQCVEAGVCEIPTTCSWGVSTYNDSSKKDHPVVCVQWHDAQAYCEWAGARLPTEAEWEKAARGVGGHRYPWGNIDPSCSMAQFSTCGGQTVSVSSKPAGASPFDAQGMAGNVWEWVADRYDADYYDRSPANNPLGPEIGSRRVLRGGSWGSGEQDIRAANRHSYSLSFSSGVVGFRCALSDSEP